MSSLMPMPGTTAELIKRLKEAHPDPGPPSIDQISDEQARLQYALELGRRQLVCELAYLWQQTQEQINARRPVTAPAAATAAG